MTYRDILRVQQFLESKELKMLVKKYVVEEMNPKNEEFEYSIKDIKITTVGFYIEVSLREYQHKEVFGKVLVSMEQIEKILGAW
ncbi:MAG: hypothetical protein ACRDDY_03725 [Clostridium sp.]|uniref:hypothetical protein n=1 Tax=Clostridium sp. TaxID=1506 RepID=UPI003EE61239